MATRKARGSVAVALLLLASTLISSSASAAITLPKGSWLPCDPAGSNYCIESVSVQHAGQKALLLTWNATGTATTGASGSISSVVTGKALPGRWTSDSWNEKGFNSFGYDGIYIDAKPANDFVPWIYAIAQPTLTTNNQVSLAAQASNNLYPTDLDSETVIDIKIRVGNVKVGVTFGVGTDVATNIQSTSSYTLIEISGNPVMVPAAKTAKDCVDNTGVAANQSVQFQSVVVPQNDSFGFGVEGSTGKLYVGSNGICKLSTPVWNSDTKSFRYSASAPHFAPDGVTVSAGFYRAVIPYADAALMWGLTKPQDAATALIASLTTTAGGTIAATKSVSARNGLIVIDVSGFNFPSPTLDIRLNPAYKMNSTGLGTLVSTPSPKPKPTPTPKKITIQCVKGPVIKKITATSPTCPKGYKKTN
ncbi:MAG: hypothetical protein WCO08_08830 [Actinomycetes bacterium]